MTTPPPRPATLSPDGGAGPVPAPAGRPYPPFPDALPEDAIQGRYLVRFARSAEDLDRVLRLRYDVFNVELGEGLEENRATGRDLDAFDAHCHHMMVLQPRGGRLVGTYRLQTRTMAEAGRGFYCAGEFAIHDLPGTLLDQSVELGRACALRGFRTGRVMYALWRGLTTYLLRNHKRLYFGCSSLTSQDPVEGLRLYRHLLAAGHVHDQWRVEPLPALDCRAEGEDDGRPAPPLPRLFASYLRYGGKVCGPPAIDRAFRTIDFLMLLDTLAFSPRLRALLYGPPRP